jgi:polyhydroxyalkanoate synthase
LAGKWSVKYAIVGMASRSKAKGGTMFPSAEAISNELLKINQQWMNGLDHLRKFREDDIKIGTTPKELVYAEDLITLYRYTPVVDSPHPVPLLISYALVNRPYMVDLQEDRSLVRELLKRGLDVYLIDWGYPTRGDRWLTLDDYINGYLGNCVDAVRAAHGIDQINILGICQGGTFSLCYTALQPDKVKNLVTMVTPVDFSVSDGLLNCWVRGGRDNMNADLMVDALGNIPGDFMNFGYLLLKPFQLSVDKYIHMGNILDDEDKLVNFLRMEKWIFDSPDQAGEAWKQFITDFYQDNRLVAGGLMIGDQQVDLGNITMPVLNVFAEKDHLVPPSSSKVLGEHVGSDDYTMRSFPVGHIGMYVSGKVQRDLPPTIAEWVKAR